MPENCANIIDLLIEQRHNQGLTQKEQVIDMIKNDLEGRNLRASDYGIKL